VITYDHGYWCSAQLGLGTCCAGPRAGKGAICPSLNSPAGRAVAAGGSQEPAGVSGRPGLVARWAAGAGRRAGEERPPRLMDSPWRRPGREGRPVAGTGPAGPFWSRVFFIRPLENQLCSSVRPSVRPPSVRQIHLPLFGHIERG
jgi:hypothetical protein